MITVGHDIEGIVTPPYARVLEEFVFMCFNFYHMDYLPSRIWPMVFFLSRMRSQFSSKSKVKSSKVAEGKDIDQKIFGKMMG